MVNKNRAVYIFKYLWDHTDEEHQAITVIIWRCINRLDYGKKTVTTHRLWKKRLCRKQS